jgi:hypothetical protein
LAVFLVPVERLSCDTDIRSSLCNSCLELHVPIPQRGVWVNKESLAYLAPSYKA